MGELVNFCAGADLRNLPAKPIDALLLNVLDHGSTPSKIAAAKEMLRLARPQKSTFDSSGFQLLQGQLNGKKIWSDPDLEMKNKDREINLAPKHVMEVAAIFQPDIVVGLDLPIRKLESAAERESEFERKLQYNVRWAYESAMWQKTLCPRAKLFMPIQCYNLHQLNTFFRRIDGVAYDGVSMPIRGLNLGEIALFMVSFYQRRIDRVHLLGTFSFGVIALCAYLSRHMFGWVSLDATSWRKAAEYGEFFNPLDLSRERLTPTMTIDSGPVNDCPCPFCQGGSFTQIQGLPRRDKVDLLRKHNWWVLDQACRDLYANSTDIVRLERFLRARWKRQDVVDEIITALSLVDTLKDEDIEVLQSLLSPIFQKRKRSRTSRRTSVPA